MTWGRRIRLYLTGFGLGLLICWIVFFRHGNRNISAWTPNNRVTLFIAKAKKIEVDSALLCKMICNEISIDMIRQNCVKGEVNFDKSETQKEPCHEYDINMTIGGKPLEFYFSACMQDSTVKILRILPELKGDKCGCK